MADQNLSRERSSRDRRRRRARSNGGSAAVAARPARKVDYHRLVNPFEPVRVYSDDQIAAIHDMALKVLEELGMRLLLPASLDLLRAKGRDGVSIDDDARHCRFGRDLVAEAIETAPSGWTLHGGAPETATTSGNSYA